MQIVTQNKNRFSHLAPPPPRLPPPPANTSGEGTSTSINFAKKLPTPAQYARRCVLLFDGKTTRNLFLHWCGARLEVCRLYLPTGDPQSPTEPTHCWVKLCSCDATWVDTLVGTSTPEKFGEDRNNYNCSEGRVNNGPLFSLEWKLSLLWCSREHQLQMMRFPRVTRLNPSMLVTSKLGVSPVQIWLIAPLGLHSKVDNSSSNRSTDSQNDTNLQRNNRFRSHDFWLSINQFAPRK